MLPSSPFLLFCIMISQLVKIEKTLLHLAASGENKSDKENKE
jgi:hypothetical protein